MTDASTPSRTIGPVHRAFGLLQAVVAAGEPVGVRELARRTGLSKSSVGRLLATLAELEMVERFTDGRAVPGSALATLAGSAVASVAIMRGRFRQLLPELVERFGESAAIGVDDGMGFLYLATEPGPGAVQVPDSRGKTYPFHVVASGVIAMAWWDADRLEEYFAESLVAATTHSVVAETAIRKRLRDARSDQFMWTDQELDLEVNGLATPIHSHDELIAVASLYGPSYRFSPGAQPNLAAEFRDFVQERVAARL